MTASKIEWTGRSDWNPVRGCTRASEGCRHCYAEQIAGRFSDPEQAFHGFATRTSAGGRWTGRVELREDRLTLPLRWRKPATVFVNSTSDIFHESLPDEAIDRIFAVMALAPQHTFQVLTKRAERMREYLTRLSSLWHDAGDPFDDRIGTQLVSLSGSPCAISAWEDQFVLPNVWLGVSVEDQAAADTRIPHLLATPAALRFLSCEPLLGPVDVRQWIHDYGCSACGYGGAVNERCRGCGWTGSATHQAGPCPDCSVTLQDDYACPDCDEPDGEGDFGPTISGDRLGLVDWVIAGGESGRGARPMHPDWARSLRDQCAAAGTPFFFKQHGDWIDGGKRIAQMGTVALNLGAPQQLAWPDGSITHSGSAVDHGGSAMWLRRVGKALAGRTLDGIEHLAMPA